MGYAEIEGAAHHGAGVLELIHAAEVVPQSKRNGRKFDAAASGAAILHGVVTLVIGYVHNDTPRGIQNGTHFTSPVSRVSVGYGKCSGTRETAGPVHFSGKHFSGNSGHNLALETEGYLKIEGY